MRITVLVASKEECDKVQNTCLSNGYHWKGSRRDSKHKHIFGFLGDNKEFIFIDKGKKELSWTEYNDRFSFILPAKLDLSSDLDIE